MNPANQAYHLLGNPFPGLRAFRDSESHLFFGREEHIADVRKKLEDNHFVAVVGTSGTGKSSLIRAGVLPNLLAEKSDEGSSIWELVTITPGNDPLLNLANAIAPIVESDDIQAKQKRVFALISENPLGLVQAFRGKIPKGKRLLILVDQFEEVFRFADEDTQVHKDVYNHFVRILIDTMRQRDVPIYIILTLRSDFLGDCVRFEGLPESINDGHYLVPRMAESQVSKVITGPIEYAGGKISPRVVQEIVQNIGDDSDRLPILQHALMRTYDVWKAANVAGDPIDIKHLKEVGGLEMALSKHADEAYHDLDPDGRSRIEQVLKCLTVKTADNRGVRRPMTLQALAAVTQNSEEAILKCLEPFRKAGRTFILPGLDEKVNSQTIFDISHESLMRGWIRLRDWTDEEMESSAIYNRICDAAILHKRGEAALWRDPELQLAIDWQNTQKPTKEWGLLYDQNYDFGLGFLAESAKQAGIEKSKVKKRKVLLRSGVTAFLIIVSMLSGWALFQTNIATEKSLEAQANSEAANAEKERAESEKERAESEKLKAIEASDEAEKARDLAEEQALIAENQSKIAQSERTKAEIAAARALEEQKRAENQENIANERNAEVLIAKQKADSSRDAAYRLRMVALSQNLAYESAQIQQDPELAALLAIQSYQLADENGGNTNSQSIYASATNALSKLDPNYSPIAMRTDQKILELKANNGVLAMVDEIGNYKTFNSTSFALSDETQTGLSLEKVNTAYISPGANRFVVGLNSFEALGFDANNPKPAATFSGFKGLVRAVAFENGFDQIITGDRDGQLIVWKNNSIQQSMDLGARISTISLQSNANSVLVGCADGNAYNCNLTENKKVKFRGRSGVRVEVITQSADGRRVVIGYSDGLTEILSKDGRLIKSLPGIGAVNFIAVDSEQNLLAVTTTNKRLSLYNLSNLTLLPVEVKLDRPISAVSYDPQSLNVYIGCSDRTFHKYAVRSSAYISQLKSKVTRSLTEEEWTTFMGEDVLYNNSIQSNK
ncbi:MAG: WD40 repeat protein/energy-coupling factor transporter ATP-binding protein EcfA2 [Cryomorphaceae bacterium]